MLQILITKNMKGRTPYSSSQLQRSNQYDTNTDHQHIQSPSPMRNVRRAQQISSLHQQFEDLKKKIKEVQNKNQKIIQKIHKAFNFKKKGTGVYTQEHLSVQQPTSSQHIVYYDKNYLQSSIVGGTSPHNYQHQGKSNKSNESEFQYKMNKHVSVMQPSRKIQQRKSINRTPLNISAQYVRNSQGVNLIQRQISQRGSIINSIPKPQNRITVVPVQQFSSNQTTMALYDQKINQLESSLEFQKDKVLSLNTQLQQKQAELYSFAHINQKFRTYSHNAHLLIQNSFLNFIEANAVKCFMTLEKQLKKNQNRLIRLNNNLEDYIQEKKLLDRSKSTKFYQRIHHRLSENKKKDSILQRQKSKNNKTGNIDLSKSQSKINDSSAISTKKKKEFQQITLQYQNMIKTRNQQIQKLDKKLKNKQKQCSELKTKIVSLTKKLQDQQTKILELSKLQKSLPVFKTFQAQQLQINLLQSQKVNISSLSSNKLLQPKIKYLEQQSSAKDIRIQQLQSELDTMHDKNNMLHQQYQQNISKNRQTKSKAQQQLQIKIKTLEKQLSFKQSQHSTIQINFTQLQKKFLEKQCQLFGYSNKIKKYQHQIQMKDKKIQELEKLLVINDEPNGDEKSLIIDSNNESLLMSSNNNLRKLKDQIQKLQEQLQTKKNQVYTISKQKDLKIKQLEEKLNQFKKQNQIIKEESENLRELLKEQQNLQNFVDPSFENNEIIRIEQQLNEMTTKYNNLSKINQQIKNQNLGLNSQIMKLKSQIQFMKNTNEEKDKYSSKKCDEIDNLMHRIHQLEKKLSEKQTELQIQQKSNLQHIKELQKQWYQFQENMKNQKDDYVDPSEKSSVINVKNNYNRLVTQNQYLSEKLKEAQTTIQMQNVMQKKIIEEYKSNVQKIKLQLRQKSNLLQIAQVELQKIQRKNYYLQKSRVKISAKNENINLKQFPGLNDGNLDKSQFIDDEDSNTDRIDQLENQLRQTKDINNKLTQMSNELFEQLRIKQQQKVDLIKIIDSKSLRIQQMEDLLELKQMNIDSNISHTKQKQRQSLRSQSSLRYSAASQVRNHDKTMEIQLSEAGSSFYDNSQLIQPNINISQIFEKQEFPYQKGKLKRKQQIKLFEKTASYIKTLKQAIQEKSKRIRVLQRKIQSLRSSQLVRKDIGYDILHKKFEQSDDENFDDQDFKDYQSVQLQNKKSTHHRRYKILEHDTKLVNQQNNMLVHQIENLQEQLLKSEEQQNSLVKIKDLYKQEIKKLIKKNQQQTKAFEDELQRYRDKIQASENVHNFQALKQLFVKIVLNVGSKEQGKKKQQRKKELEEYVKVTCSILKVDTATKDKLLAICR